MALPKAGLASGISMPLHYKRDSQLDTYYVNHILRALLLSDQALVSHYSIPLRRITPPDFGEI